MISGEALGAFALTEPQAGSDAAALRTRAERVGPGRRADRVPPDRDEDLDHQRPRGGALPRLRDGRSGAGPKGITAFLVEKGTPGFRFGAHEKKMGIRACPAAELVFEAPRSRPRTVSAGRGRATGSRCRPRARAASRSPPACVGLAQAALEAAARYLPQRKAFGAPLADQQGLRFMLAEMAQKVAAARALTARRPRRRIAASRSRRPRRSPSGRPRMPR